jgi:hypothetical protein
MNVEIGTDAAQFPEKEYIHKWDFRCNAGHAQMGGGPVPGPIICAQKTTGTHISHFFIFSAVSGSQFIRIMINKEIFYGVTVVLYIYCTVH